MNEHGQSHHESSNVSLEDINVAREAVWLSREQVIADAETTLISEEKAVQMGALNYLDALIPYIPGFIMIEQQIAGPDFLGGFRAGIKNYFVPSTKEFYEVYDMYGNFSPELDPDSDLFIGYDQLQKKYPGIFVQMKLVLNDRKHEHRDRRDGVTTTDSLGVILAEAEKKFLNDADIKDEQLQNMQESYKEAVFDYENKRNAIYESGGEAIKRRLLNLRDLIAQKYGKRHLPNYVADKIWIDGEKFFRVFLINDGRLVRTPRKKVRFRDKEIPDFSTTEEANPLEWFEEGPMFASRLLQNIKIDGRNLSQILFQDLR